MGHIDRGFGGGKVSDVKMFNGPEMGILRACLYEAGWPVSELARQQASPVLYERFESEPARLLVATCRHSFV